MSELSVCPFCGDDLPDEELVEDLEFDNDGNEVCPGCGEVL